MALAALKDELDTWDAALQAFDSEDFAGALAIFEKISDTSKVAMNIGLIFMYQGNYELAAKRLTNAIVLDHYLAIGYFQRGVCRYHLNKMDQALQDFCDAEIMMRGNEVVYYRELGLQFELQADQVLLNRILTLEQLGRTDETPELLARSSARAQAIHASELFSMPNGLLFRPPLNKRLFLSKYQQASGTNGRPIPDSSSASPPPFSAGFKSQASSTCAPSESDGGSVRSLKRSISDNDEKHKTTSESSGSSSSPRYLRSDLIKAMGPDLVFPTTEISTIPCAGVRIASGKLLGLMCWRLIVELDSEGESSFNEKRHSWTGKGQKGKFKFQHKKAAVVSNFILDTGCAKSVISQEMLRALGYKGGYRPGTDVALRIQGLRCQCVVAQLGEASRLGGQFMTSGNLTFYFDNKLNAPVLYVGDEANERPTMNIPRTVAVAATDPRVHRSSFKDSISSLIALLHWSKATGTTVM